MFRLVLIAVLASLLALPGPGVALADGPCQTAIPQGVWEGTTHVLMDIKGIQDGQLLQEFVFHDDGQLSLTIECAVTAGTYHLNVLRTIDFYTTGGHTACAYTVDFSQGTGSVVAGANGKPRIDVRWGQTAVQNSCLPDDKTVAPGTWQFSPAGPPQGRTMQGDFRIRYDNGGQDYDDLAQLFRSQGYTVTLDKSFTLTRRPQPKVQGLAAQLRQYFLRGIPVTNRYTAAIDWDGGDPGAARFLLGDDPPRAMSVSGSTATYDLALGSINRNGDIPISVEAELDGRRDRLDNLGPLTLVDVPAWADYFHLQPRPQSDHVLYKGEYRLPDQPLNAHVDIPTLVPYVGGTWGLLPTQFKVGLTANSLGNREQDGISAQGGFGLGKRRFNLIANGKVYGTLTHDHLQFESDQLSLSTSGIFYQEQIGLVSLIPGASTLFDVPVIGDLLKALNGALGVSADVHGAMQGRGRLGIVGNTPALTEGSFDASLGVKAAAGINTPVAWANVTGGGDGSLSMMVVPNVKVTNCRILLYFQAGAGAFGYVAGPVAASYPVYQCTTSSGQSVLLTTAAGAAAARMTYGQPGLNPDERSVVQIGRTNGLSETVLVENASLQAQPALVMGPNGQQALVWNSLGTSGAADGVSVRLYDGANWGSVITVSQANRPAFNPSAAFAANGDLLVAWSEAQTAPSPSGLTADFARSLEIAWVQLSPATGQVVRRGQATSDNTMDFAPRLSAARDGSVWLVWQNSPATSLAGTAAAPNRLLATKWTGSGWTATETANDNLVGALFWQIAAVDAQNVWIAADGDTDGNLSTASDREIFVYKRTATGWAPAQRLTNDTVVDSGPLLALTPDGQPALAWRHGDTVLGLIGDPATTQPQVWFDAHAGVGPMLASGQLLVGAGGKMALLWAEGTDQGQDVWLSRYDPARRAWSQPAPLFRSVEQRRSLSASLLANGDMLLGLAAAQVSDQTVTFTGGGTTTVPAVAVTARLLVTRIPAAFIPSPLHPQRFFPSVLH